MRRPPLLPLVLCLAACAPGGGPLIRVVNADSVTLDRVIIDAAGSDDALGWLLPGTAGQVRPAPAPDSTIRVRHGAGGPFTITAAGMNAARVVEIRLHSDSAGGIRLEQR